MISLKTSTHHAKRLHICLMIHIKPLIHFNHCCVSSVNLKSKYFIHPLQDSFPNFLYVHFHSTLNQIQHMNPSIHTLQLCNYHKTELMLKANKHKNLL